MLARGIIARKVGHTWEGRYHHFDGYPSGLGKELFKIYSSVFDHDSRAMMKMLIDDHPAGWSSIINADWSLEPGCGKEPAPACYCHGNRKFEPNTNDDYARAKFLYIISGHIMTVYENESNAISGKSSNFFDYPLMYGWRQIMVVDMLDKEPIWK